MVDKKPENTHSKESSGLLEKMTQKILHGYAGEAERVPLKVTTIYITVGALWILLSDKILALLVSDKELITYFSMIKGWMYVAITGILIYALIYSSFKRIRLTENELVGSNQSLSAANKELELAYGQLAASITELKEYELKLRYLAYHDQLTGQKNRFALNERLNTWIKQDGNHKFALLFIDIDNFKYVNDTMGHTFGDILLVKASERLVALQESSWVYRLGGDEFIVFVEDFKNREDIERLAVNILKGFKYPIEVNESSLVIQVSIGVSIYPDHGRDMDALLKSADIAVYKAKETGKNRIVFYNEPMNEAVAERVSIEKHLRTALEKNEFELYYQPQLDIDTNKISGFEALIRWNNSELGLVSPKKFISIAEDTLLIIQIGEWVLRAACLFLKKLHQIGYTYLNISVNISILQLLQDDFMDMVMETIESIGINAEQVELEITESVLMESYEAIAGKLRLLRAKGLKIALDDFGKGYSSLNYLRQLPITTLKIDKTFIDTISNAGKNKSLADFIVKIGRSMELCVVAEGVESQEQMDYLIEHKCSKIQGYLFSKPLMEIEAIKRLEQGITPAGGKV